MLGYGYGGHSQGLSPSNSTSRLLNDFRNGSRGAQRGQPDPAKEIHRMLESCSFEISKTGVLHCSIPANCTFLSRPLLHYHLV